MTTCGENEELSCHGSAMVRGFGGSAAWAREEAEPPMGRYWVEPSNEGLPLQKIEDVGAEAFEVGLDGVFDGFPQKKAIEELEDAGDGVGDGEADDAVIVAIVEPDCALIGETIDGFPADDLMFNDVQHPRPPGKF